MKQYTFSPPSSINGIQGVDLTSNIIINKGPLKLNIDLKDSNIGNHNIIKLDLNFKDSSDESDNVFENYIFLEERPNFTNVFSHIYNTSKTSKYEIKYKPEIIITFSNFKTYTYVLDIRIYKDSFYSKHKRLDINSAQFVDDVNDTMFLVCKNMNGDKFNILVK